MIRKEAVIGPCRLLLGDCMEILPTLGKFDAVVTDPPFGMVFRSNYRTVRTKYHAIENDDNDDCLKYACNIDASHSKYIFCRWDNLSSVPKPRSVITWVKNNWSMGDLEHEHARQTELILFYRHDKHSFPCGRPADVVSHARTGNNQHPTEKPVSLMEDVISWTEGEVLDPFMGSGTTGVACIKTGRQFTGIEIDEKYYDIAVRRCREAWGDGSLFDEKRIKEDADLFAAVG